MDVALAKSFASVSSDYWEWELLDMIYNRRGADLTRSQGPDADAGNASCHDISCLNTSHEATKKLSNKTQRPRMIDYLCYITLRKKNNNYMHRYNKQEAVPIVIPQ
jgi:hypothetical protein